MRFPQFILVLFLLFIVYACNKNDANIDPNYPTVVSGLSLSKSNEILDQLAQTTLFNCMYIDTFGFPFFDIEYDDICINEDWEINNTLEEIEARAQKALFDYAGFLNIDNQESIQILSVATTEGTKYEQFKTSHPDSLPNTWLVSTQQQKYDDLTVRGSFLQILLSPEDVIGISGHWYNFIYIPEVEKFSEEDAITSIYNQSFTYDNEDIIPTENITWHTSKKIIWPIFRSNDQIELHVCWALYPSSWEIVVDSETGDILSSLEISNL